MESTTTVSSLPNTRRGSLIPDQVQDVAATITAAAASVAYNTGVAMRDQASAAASTASSAAHSARQSFSEYAPAFRERASIVAERFHNFGSGVLHRRRTLTDLGRTLEDVRDLVQGLINTAAERVIRMLDEAPPNQEASE